MTPDPTQPIDLAPRTGEDPHRRSPDLSRCSFQAAVARQRAVIKQLIELGEQHENGVLTDEELTAENARVLRRCPNPDDLRAAGFGDPPRALRGPNRSVRSPVCVHLSPIHRITSHRSTLTVVAQTENTVADGDVVPADAMVLPEDLVDGPELATSEDLEAIDLPSGRCARERVPAVAQHLPPGSPGQRGGPGGDRTHDRAIMSTTSPVQPVLDCAPDLRFLCRSSTPSIQESARVAEFLGWILGPNPQHLSLLTRPRASVNRQTGAAATPAPLQRVRSSGGGR